MPEEEKKVEKTLLVVKELPTQQYREVSDGKEIYDCLTIEEALTEVLQTVRELKKKLD